MKTTLMFQVSQCSAHAPPRPSVILTAWPTRILERHKELRGDRSRRAEPKWPKGYFIPYRNKNHRRSWLRLPLYGGWWGLVSWCWASGFIFFHHLFFLALFVSLFKPPQCGISLTFTFSSLSSHAAAGSEWVADTQLPTKVNTQQLPSVPHTPQKEMRIYQA